MAAKECIEKIDSLERIGVIGSPSNNATITVDILESACKKSLIGSFTIFKFNQDSQINCALGQITEINLRNVWTEDPTMKGLIRRKGEVNPITGRQDTHVAEMLTSSVFKQIDSAFDPSTLGTVPQTGTAVKLVTDEILGSLLEDYKDELFYLGNIYGSEPKLPTWFKHFDKGKGGLGEAYHIGIFGKTGSGKSFLAKMMTSAYAQHKNMSIFIIDPQGEFTKDCRRDSMLNKVFVDKLGRKVKLFNLHNLVLSGEIVVQKILVDSGFFEDLLIKHPDNRGNAASSLLKFMKQKKIKPWKYKERASFDAIWDFLSNDDFLKATYSGKDGQARVKSSVESLDEDTMFKKWERISNLFAYKGDNNIVIKDLVDQSFQEGEKDIVVVDLSNSNIPENLLWNDEIRYIVINELLERLVSKSEEVYKDDKYLNSLVILDEAHKFAPRENSGESENLNKIKSTLVNAVRTTRKCGLGWMFISQTLASLDKEIINQVRVFTFGFGLCWGTELDSLKQIIGGNRQAISLYQSFKDPQSGFKKKEYPFMMLGPISPLSFTSTPMFFTALNFHKEFLEVNGLK